MTSLRNGNAERGKKVEHYANVHDLRRILQNHRLIRKERCRKHREYGVFIAGGAEGAGQLFASVDNEARHGGRMMNPGPGMKQKREIRLLHRHAFRQVAWFINICATGLRGIIGEKLERNNIDQR